MFILTWSYVVVSSLPRQSAQNLVRAYPTYNRLVRYWTNCIEWSLHWTRNIAAYIVLHWLVTHVQYVSTVLHPRYLAGADGVRQSNVSYPVHWNISNGKLPNLRFGRQGYALSRFFCDVPRGRNWELLIWRKSNKHQCALKPRKMLLYNMLIVWRRRKYIYTEYLIWYAHSFVLFWFDVVRLYPICGFAWYIYLNHWGFIHWLNIWIYGINFHKIFFKLIMKIVAWILTVKII